VILYVISFFLEALGAMRVLVYGATWMIGSGVLRECLLDGGVREAVTIGRTATGVRHEKLREIVREDLLDYGGLEGELRGFDACYYCLGVTSAGMAEADYRRMTYGLAVAAGEALRRWNPGMTFVFVSGAGADSTETGPVMWARVKGKTENALLAMGFGGCFVFRPAGVQAMHGERSKAWPTRIAYALFGPLFPLVRWVKPGYVLTTEQMGRAMLHVARHGAAKRVLESADIAAIG
jgi:uncharacterized protein YbjT (DUF2867 family)